MVVVMRHDGGERVGAVGVLVLIEGVVSNAAVDRDRKIDSRVVDVWR